MAGATHIGTNIDDEKQFGPTSGPSDPVFFLGQNGDKEPKVTCNAWFFEEPPSYAHF